MSERNGEVFLWFWKRLFVNSFSYDRIWKIKTADNLICEVLRRNYMFT
jgi:hypothetical protein